MVQKTQIRSEVHDPGKNNNTRNMQNPLFDINNLFQNCDRNLASLSSVINWLWWFPETQKTNDDWLHTDVDCTAGKRFESRPQGKRLAIYRLVDHTYVKQACNANRKPAKNSTWSACATCLKNKV